MHADDHKNLALHISLFTKTVELVKQTNLPYIIIDEQLQHGNTFGEKFCNAIDYTFGRGFDNLITIGSDCAALTVKNILQGSEAILRDEAIVGKDNHNGVYLMGFKRKAYNRNQFLWFNWGTSELFKNVLQYFTATYATAPQILKVRIDINHHKDLQKVVTAFSASILVKALISILQPLISYFSAVERLIISFFTCNKTYRGPPQLF